MSSSTEDMPLSAALPETAAPPDAGGLETRNLWTLAIHQIAWRVGWTFKTDSIILPAFLDRLAGAGWVRGLLPLLRFAGQTVPPVFAADALKAMPTKKWALAGLAAVAGLPYFVFAGIWLALGGQKVWWMIPLFLVLHFLFAVVYGLYLVAWGTLQGKLVRPTRRGLLLWGATFGGLFPTVAFCSWLMPGWLGRPAPGYGYLFLAVGGGFLVSAVVACLVREPASDVQPASSEPRLNGFHQTVQAIRNNANLRRLVALIIFSGIGPAIVPHYQSFARQALGLSDKNLVLFVITQTTAVSIYSVLLGPAADRWGYRLTLRWAILGAAIAPAYVLCIPWLTAEVAPDWFWLVYIPLGLTPLLPTIIANYALELCPPQEHPRYLSIVSLAFLPPYLLSPAVGGLVDLAGFDKVALGTVVVMLAGAVLTFRLDEPRHRNPTTAHELAA